MAYVVCKHPVVRIDIMVPQKLWPQMIGFIKQSGCTYFKEDWIELPNERDYTVIRDIKSEHPWQLGILFGLIKTLESSEEYAESKIYILIKPRKKGKKHVQKNRKEAGAGSEGGNAGGSGDLQPGGTAGPGESGTEFNIPGVDNIRQLEMFGGEEGDTDGNHIDYQ